MRAACFALLTACLLALSPHALAAGQRGKNVNSGIWVRDGYTLTLAAHADHNPRFMALGPDGTVYVSSPGEGVITAYQRGEHGTLTHPTPFVTGFKTVQAMQWHDGWLYFTQTGSVHRAQDTDGDHKADKTQNVIPESKLPHMGGGHWWRSLLIHGGRIYTSIGDPHNITDVDASKDKWVRQREKIWSFHLDGSDKKLFISGIRNTEKLVLRPGTDEVWGMDHGSDWFGRKLGDTNGDQPITNVNPPGEMNHYIAGHFYGHPFLVGDRVPRPEYQDRDDLIQLADKTTIPQWTTPAHWAPNAMAFYDADQFPGFRGDALVAFHGSWNRHPRAGYRVDRVLFEKGRPFGQQPMVKFLGGKPEKPTVLGRPVDVLVDQDGSVLISDDRGDNIYRLSYTAGK